MKQQQFIILFKIFSGHIELSWPTRFTGFIPFVLTDKFLSLSIFQEKKNKRNVYIQQEGGGQGKVGRDMEIGITDDEGLSWQRDWYYMQIDKNSHDIQIGVTGWQEKIRDTSTGITDGQGKVCHDKGIDIICR
jgi:hypothetical protein